MASSSNVTALITGAAKRIGRATALALAGQGIHIVAHYGSSKNDARNLAETIESLGVRCWVVGADLGRREQVASLVERAKSMAGSIEILINNGSIFPKNRLMEFSGDDLDRNIQINAFAPLVLSREFAARAQQGVIINFLDSRIADFDVEHAAYHLSKRVLFSLTRMLALELAPRIRVNAIAPGLILPPVGEDQSYLERMRKTNPLERVGELDEITETVKFLIANRFVTGQVVFVDGGRHLKGAYYG
ncbi:MAG: SDR family oxidoreductase [Deltaproteobacteria bacterium]|nr:SDR family oxidoreductase [Deltaproteobacteria bacterium]